LLDFIDPAELAPKCLGNSNSPEHQNIRQEICDLEVLVEKARIFVESEYESDESSIITGSESSETTESLPLGVANALKIYVGCLMELLPSMEETLSELEYEGLEEQPNHQPVEFHASGPAQPYVLKVYDKFPKANLRLIHRLGEANWQRHMSLRKTNTQIEDEQVPERVFIPVSLFHDSGLGSSLPARSTYAATTASHSSFQTTAADKNNGDLRVPPTPKEVSEGVPFSCQICGHVLSRIEHRIHWR
jgi:hypothetical protein